MTTSGQLPNRLSKVYRLEVTIGDVRYTSVGARQADGAIYETCLLA